VIHRFELRSLKAIQHIARSISPQAVRRFATRQQQGDQIRRALEQAVEPVIRFQRPAPTSTPTTALQYICTSSAAMLATRHGRPLSNGLQIRKAACQRICRHSAGASSSMRISTEREGWWAPPPGDHPAQNQASHSAARAAARPRVSPAGGKRLQARASSRSSSAARLLLLLARTVGIHSCSGLSSSINTARASLSWSLLRAVSARRNRH